MSITTSDTAPRVWAACLCCYNSGRLIGRWVDCIDVADITMTMLHEGADGPYVGCEEVWCLDLDCLPVDHEMDLLEAAQWGRVFTEVGGEHWPALCAWVRSAAYVAEDNGEIPCVSDFEERYCGLWDSFREYAEQLADDIGLTNGWPEEAQRYFDWNAWTCDLQLEYTVVNAPAPAYGVFIFRDL